MAKKFKEYKPYTKEYMRVKDKVIASPLSYSGNKRLLVPILMKYLPSKVHRFVDMFGGTGLTGANAYKFNMCDEVIYNDLEYDLVLFLEWLHVTPIDEIVEGYKQVQERWFGNAEGILKDKKGKYREKERDAWKLLVDDYNDNRLFLWDNPEDVDEKKILKSVPDKMIRAQLEQYLQYQNSDLTDVKKRGKDKEKNKAWRQRRNAEMAMDHNLGRTWGTAYLDIFASHGDFFKAPELMFLFMNALHGFEFRDNGRIFGERTPRSGKFKPIDKILPFIEEWKRTPVTFFSHSFEDGWIEIDTARPRQVASLARWRRMLGSLTPNDVVFLDPPYHGSNAKYNKNYKQTSDIYLMAFCQLLTQRGIPWVLTNNLYWENDIFKEWITNYYAFKLKPDALKIYTDPSKEFDKAPVKVQQADIDLKNSSEVIVSNFEPSNRKILTDYLELMPIEGNRPGMITWMPGGKRTWKDVEGVEHECSYPKK